MEKKTYIVPYTFEFSALNFELFIYLSIYLYYLTLFKKKKNSILITFEMKKNIELWLRQRRLSLNGSSSRFLFLVAKFCQNEN